MIAYHNLPELKKQAIADARACLLANHSLRYVSEERWGIPLPLAVLQDLIFDHTPEEFNETWTERFFSAIRVGSDLSGVFEKLHTWFYADNVSWYSYKKTDTPAIAIYIAEQFLDLLAQA